jgi:hypothetical protein
MKHAHTSPSVRTRASLSARAVLAVAVLADDDDAATLVDSDASGAGVSNA